MKIDNVMAVTEHMMAYLIGKEEKLSIVTDVDGEHQDFFNEQDRLHLADVRNLFLGGLKLRNYAVILATILMIVLRAKKADFRRLVPLGYLQALFVYLILAAILGVAMSIDFTSCFTLFHKLFFTNNLWIFDPETDYTADLDFEKTYATYTEYADKLKPYVCDTITLLHKALEEDKKVVVEGAQATLLDIDFGSYPFVTSSNPTIGGILTGTGLSAADIGNVYGVIKAYSSRVGEGPYVTELLDATGDKIRELGHEYGTTTGRPRRCGWLDLVTLKYAKRVNGLTALSVNHLDTIGNFDKIQVCVGYDVNGTVTEDFTTNLNILNNAKPVYKELAGGWSDIASCKTFEELPENAQNYIKFIEEYIGVPVKFIGTGAEREAMIVR